MNKFDLRIIAYSHQYIGYQKLWLPTSQSGRSSLFDKNEQNNSKNKQQTKQRLISFKT